MKQRVSVFLKVESVVVVVVVGNQLKIEKNSL